MQVQTDLILESELFLLGCALSVCQIPTSVSVLVIMVKREEGRALPVITPIPWLSLDVANEGGELTGRTSKVLCPCLHHTPCQSSQGLL